jgi:ferric-dicitrate binding protein FerR (iron transport regulator)
MLKWYHKGGIMKTNTNIENWDLIAKYYADECSQKEIESLNIWITDNKNNEQIFNQVKKDLELINLTNSMNKVNVDSAWEKVKDRIQEADENESNVSKGRTINFLRVLKYAAMVVILLGIGFITNKIYQNTTNNELIEYLSNTEQGKELILPDGSTVVLNANSKISFDKVFASNERRVVLEGEAFFDVTKKPNKPFIIETNDAEVKVLGTSFNVNANFPNKQVEVFVKTGLVELSNAKDKDNKILIEPGNIGILDNKEITKHTNIDVNKIAWKTKEIVFKEERLDDVINTLNRVYNANIICYDQAVLNLKYTSTFKDQEIDSILNVICMTFNLKVDYAENKIKLINHLNLN